jgi:hypothetical protein
MCLLKFLMEIFFVCAKGCSNIFKVYTTIYMLEAPFQDLMLKTYFLVYLQNLVESKLNTFLIFKGDKVQTNNLFWSHTFQQKNLQC